MNAKPHSPEWLIANADHGVAFERACASALERLLAENASLQQQLEAIGAGGVGPLMSRSRPDDVALSRAAVEQALDALKASRHRITESGGSGWKLSAQACTNAIAALRATLERAQAQSGGISPDWKPVPVVPTEKMLDAGRNACEGRFYPQDMLHGPRAMMADRWVAMINAAPQPPTTEQSSVVEQPQGERHPGVLMPSRSLVDQVIREIARYCNTGEMDDAESLLANLQVSIDPAQQPPQELKA